MHGRSFPHVRKAAPTAGTFTGSMDNEYLYGAPQRLVRSDDVIHHLVIVGAVSTYKGH
jgi:hypothetical protein